MSMMREGKATVYAGPPTWDDAEVILKACKFSSARMFLVGRCLPGLAKSGVAAEHRMAVAWLQTDGQWTHDEAGLQSLGWSPLYLAEPPAFPPWPPVDHPAVAGILGVAQSGAGPGAQGKG